MMPVFLGLLCIIVTLLGITGTVILIVDACFEPVWYFHPLRRYERRLEKVEKMERLERRIKDKLYLMGSW